MNVREASQDALPGVVLVTHIDYGDALLRAAEFVLGPLLDCTSIQVDASLDVGETVTRLQEAVSRLDRGKGVIILTDMFGGTPTNLSLSLLGTKAHIEVVTGVNLPMLLKVFENRALALAELAELAVDAGQKGIVSASAVLYGKENGSRAK